jgi:hypothetical protein
MITLPARAALRQGPEYGSQAIDAIRRTLPFCQGCADHGDPATTMRAPQAAAGAFRELNAPQPYGPQRRK